MQKRSDERFEKLLAVLQVRFDAIDRRFEYQTRTVAGQFEAMQRQIDDRFDGLRVALDARFGGLERRVSRLERNG